MVPRCWEPVFKNHYLQDPQKNQYSFIGKQVCLQRAALEEARVGSVFIRLSFDKTAFICLFFFKWLAIIYILITMPADDLWNKNVSQMVSFH